MDNAILLAESTSRARRFADKIQKYIQKKYAVSVPLRELHIKTFRNREYEPYVQENIRKKDVYFIHDSTKEPCRWVMDIILVGDLLYRASAKSVTLVAPDMPWNRQDRKERPHVPISARAVADIISTNSDRLITMDLHKDQVQGFYPKSFPVDPLKSFPAVVRHIKSHKSIPLENLVLVAADGGDIERVGEYLEPLGIKYPLGVIYKERNPVTKKITNVHFIGDVKNRDAFIIDDIVDSGGTTIVGGELLKRHGAQRLYCYDTHGLFTEGTSKFTPLFDKVMTSNTHCYTHRKGSEIVDVAYLFAEAIYNAQIGESISELFKANNK